MSLAFLTKLKDLERRVQQLESIVQTLLQAMAEAEQRLKAQENRRRTP